MLCKFAILVDVSYMVRTTAADQINIVHKDEITRTSNVLECSTAARQLLAQCVIPHSPASLGGASMTLKTCVVA